MWTPDTIIFLWLSNKKILISTCHGFPGLRFGTPTISPIVTSKACAGLFNRMYCWSYSALKPLNFSISLNFLSEKSYLGCKLIDGVTLLSHSSFGCVQEAMYVSGNSINNWKKDYSLSLKLCFLMFMSKSFASSLSNTSQLYSQPISSLILIIPFLFLSIKENTVLIFSSVNQEVFAVVNLFPLKSPAACLYSLFEYSASVSSCMPSLIKSSFSCFSVS